MYGTTLGGEHARDSNIQRYGGDFYRTIGKKGGETSRGGGFANDPELARAAGRKGGKASRRPTVLKVEHQCPVCYTVFSTYPKAMRIFCSRACSGAYRKQESNA